VSDRCHDVGIKGDPSAWCSTHGSSVDRDAGFANSSRATFEPSAGKQPAKKCQVPCVSEWRVLPSVQTVDGYLVRAIGQRKWAWAVRSLKTLLAIGAAAVVAIVGAAAVRDDSDPVREIVVSPLQSPPTGLNAASELPFDVVPELVVAAGDRVMTVGTAMPPNEPRSVLVSFEPSTGIWTESPAIPAEEPLHGLDGVWTGKALAVLGVRCAPAPSQDDAAVDASCEPGALWAGLYDPSSNSWSEIEAPPVKLKHPSDGAFGRAIGSSGDAAVFEIDGAFWAYEPAAGSWRALPTVDGPSDFACSTGDRVLVGGGVADVPAGKESSGLYDQNGAEFVQLSADLKAWEPLPRLDVHAAFPEVFGYVCSSESILAATFSFKEVHILRLGADAWEQLPPPEPEITAEPFPDGFTRAPSVAAPSYALNAAWTGEAFVWWNPAREYTIPIDGKAQAVHFPGNGFTFSPPTKSWALAPAGPAAYGPTDSNLVAWVNGTGFAFDDSNGTVNLFTYRP